jgi:hypothetical protein
LTSALPSEADIQLILVKGSANDPERPYGSFVHGQEIKITTIILCSFR